MNRCMKKLFNDILVAIRYNLEDGAYMFDGSSTTLEQNYPVDNHC